MSSVATLKPADWSAVARRLAPGFAARAAAADANDEFVATNFAELKAAGLMSAGVPAQFGGGDATPRELAEVLRILAQACGSTALAFAMHTHQAATAAYRWRHQSAPVEPLLRRIAAENLVLVSSGGSDWLPGSGKAVRTEGGYLVTARKVFASGSPVGDLLLTCAVHDMPAGAEVMHFAVPLKNPAVRVLDNWKVMGMRGTGSNDIEITDFFVPDAAISGRRPPGKWHPLFHTSSMIAWPLVYAVYLGIAEAARDKALALVKSRKADPSLPYVIGEMERELFAARIAYAHMVDTAAAQTPSPETTNTIMTAKTLAAGASIRTVEKAMEVAGGAGFYRAQGLERLFRDIQAARYHPLPDKVQLKVAGRLALGLPIDE